MPLSDEICSCCSCHFSWVPFVATVNWLAAKRFTRWSRASNVDSGPSSRVLTVHTICTLSTRVCVCVLRFYWVLPLGKSGWLVRAGSWCVHGGGPVMCVLVSRAAGRPGGLLPAGRIDCVMYAPCTCHSCATYVPRMHQHFQRFWANFSSATC